MRRFHVASILQCSVGLSAFFKVLWSDSVRHRTSLKTLIVLSFWGNSGMISKTALIRLTSDMHKFPLVALVDW